MEERHDEQITVGGHDIDPERDIQARVWDGTKNLVLGAFRRLRHEDGSEDPDHLLARVEPNGNPGDGTLTDEVVIPRRWDAAKEHTVEFVERHKGKIAVVGAVAVIAAASAGINIRRLKRK